MTSVTNRIKQIKQPYGGYLKVRGFSKEVIKDGKILNNQESLHASIVGQTVEYLSEMMLGVNKNWIFRISIKGAEIIDDLLFGLESFNKIVGIDDESIRNACILSGYDVIFRQGPHLYVPIQKEDVNTETTENIRIMVERTVSFFKENGPIVDVGMNFQKGYTDKITKGDGDILTEDTMWDIKVLNRTVNNKHTLQVLIYYLMGRKSIHKSDFEKVRRIGLFNPRLNTFYYLNIADIPSDTITQIEKEVIGY